jgi:hypothetical protein
MGGAYIAVGESRNALLDLESMTELKYMLLSCVRYRTDCA